MINLAGWIALAATCLAALITAANLGARITGYGFAVFFIGAISWCVVGLATGQKQLLYSNGFLAIVDVVGVWRWLVRKARAEEAVIRTRSAEEPADVKLISIERLSGKVLRDRNGGAIATVEGALANGRSGQLDFLVIRPRDASGDEPFKRLPWNAALEIDDESVTSALSAHDLNGLPAA
jgi:membrane protein implicated in regulation of membrane protease activity